MMKLLLAFVVLTNLVALNTSATFGSRLKRQATYDISDRGEYQDATGRDYMLAASSENVLKRKNVNNQLVCSKAGMFADVNNFCQVFHFCVETGRPDGSGYDLRQYSFFCGAGTIFDQYKLTCEVPEKAIPCEFAPLFYEINERTDEGKKEVFIHSEDDKEIVHPYYEQASRPSKQSKVTDDDRTVSDDEQ